MASNEHDLEVYKNLSLHSREEIQEVTDMFTFAFLALAPFMICLNGMVVFVTILFKHLRSPYDYFIITIASADILVGLVEIPLYAIAYNSYLGGKVVDDHIDFWSILRCVGPLATLRFPQFVNLFSCFIISVERSVAVNWPFVYSNVITRKSILSTVYGTWFVAFLLAIPPVVVVVDSREILEQSGTCNPYLVPRVWILYLNDSIIVAFCVILPFILNMQVFLIVRRQWLKERNVEHLMPKDQREKVSERRKLAKFVFALIFLYIGLWIPYFLILPFQVTFFHPYTFEMIKDWVLLTNFINSIFHAPAFTFIKEDFRNAYKSMWATSPRKWCTIRQQFTETVTEAEPVRSSRSKSTVSETDIVAPRVNPLDVLLLATSSFITPEEREVYEERNDASYIRRFGKATDVLYATAL